MAGIRALLVLLLGSAALRGETIAFDGKASVRWQPAAADVCGSYHLLRQVYPWGLTPSASNLRRGLRTRRSGSEHGSVAQQRNYSRDLQRHSSPSSQPGGGPGSSIVLYTKGKHSQLCFAGQGVVQSMAAGSWLLVKWALKQHPWQILSLTLVAKRGMCRVTLIPAALAPAASAIGRSSTASRAGRPG
jgi:hypothetical protein